LIAGRLDSTLVLFWISLGVSAAIVGLFLWLMREEDPEADAKSQEADAAASAGAGGRVKSSGADRSSG
jgi:hypothetical protein